MTWLILITAFFIKIPAFTQPIVGYFASYQAINAMMGDLMFCTRDFLTPRSYHILGGQPSLHLIYYPFGSFVAGLLKFVSGHGSFVFWGRVQAALFTFLAGLCFWRSLETLFGKENQKIINWSLFLFSFSPIVLVEGVSFKNEAVSLFFLCASFMILVRHTGLFAAFLAGSLFSLALIGRLHFMFVGLAFLFVLWNRKASLLHYLIFLSGCAGLAGAWFGWTWILESKFSEQTATSLYSQSQEGRVLAESLFTSSSFYVSLAKTWGAKLLTPVGILAALWGFVKAPKEFHVFRLWLAGGLILACLLPQKVMDHPFYFIVMVPPLAVFAAFALDAAMLHYRGLKPVFLVLFILFVLRYSIPPVFSLDGNEAIPAIGQKVQSLTGNEDKIVASHGTSNDLLYYSQRLGWTFDLKMREHPMDDQARHVAMKQRGYGNPVEWLKVLQKDGAKYFVVSELKLFEQQKEIFDFVNSSYQEIPSGSKDFRIYKMEAK